MNLLIDTKTHLFICFLEELNELIEASLKVQFKFSFLSELFDEYNDLLGTMELLKEYNIDLFSSKKVESCSISELTNSLISIQKFGFKAIRFGFSDSYPNSNITNFQNIVNNLAYVECTLTNNFGFIPDKNKIKSKKERILYYLDYAKNNGTLK